MQKLSIEHWWNWHLFSISATYFNTAFTTEIAKSVKIKPSCQYVFALLGSTQVKAAHKYVESYLGSISSTFYVRIFHTNILFGSFFEIRFSFGAKILYEKCARIMLMKLTARHSVWQKNRRSISPTIKTPNLNLKLVHFLPNLFAVSQILLTRKKRKHMLMKFISGAFVKAI